MNWGGRMLFFVCFCCCCVAWDGDGEFDRLLPFFLLLECFLKVRAWIELKLN